MVGLESSLAPTRARIEDVRPRVIATRVTRSKSISFSAFDLHDRDSQNQLGKDLLANPSDWPEKESILPIRRRVWHPYILRRGNPQCSSSTSPVPLATLGAQLQSGRGGIFTQVDDVRSLCEQGHLERALDIVMLMDQHGTVLSANLYRSLLKACSKRKALIEARRLHRHLAYHGLETSKYLGEELVSTLVRCGSLDDALQVFHKLPKRNAFCWTAVISGFANCGQGREALKMYKRMQEEYVEPNTYTFVSLLKSCCSMADLEEGRRIHAHALKYNCESDLFVGTCLVDMYGKCGSIADAQDVFYGFYEWNVVLCTAMVAAYVEHGQAEKALQLYEQMYEQGLSPNDRTFVSVVQACGMLAEREGSVVVEGCSSKLKSLKQGKVLHADAWRKGHDSDVFVSTTLVSLYGKCGSIVDAETVFHCISQGNVVSWTAMLMTYIEQDQEGEALQLYEKMREEGLSPNNRTFIGVLQACSMVAEKEDEVMMNGWFAKVRALGKGKAVYAEVCMMGYGSDVFVGSSLVKMFAKCGSIVDAQNVLDRLSQPNVGVWTALLAAHVEHREVEEAFCLYEKMREEGISPNDRTFVTMLQACGMLAEMEGDLLVNGRFMKVVAFQRGKSIHANARVKGYDTDVFVGNTLVSMYGKCHSILDAQIVFDGLSQCDVVAWTAMLTACVELGLPKKALLLYEQMKWEGASANARTFVSIVQACCMLAEKETSVGNERSIKVKSLEMGRGIHADAYRIRYDTDVFVANSLISMYGNCRSTEDAQTVFDGLIRRDVVSWNALLVAYIEHGEAEKALQLYEEMSEDATSPDALTFVSMLHACCMLASKEEHLVLNGLSTKVKSVIRGKILHANIQRKACDSDVLVGSSLVTMYSRCGSIIDAQLVFDSLSQHHVVSWNAMLMAYLDGEAQAEKALQLYGQIQQEGISQDVQTFVSTLQACGIIAEKEVCTVLDEQPTKVKSLDWGKVIHADIAVKGYDSDVLVCSTLVSMYGKCGSLADAWNVFVNVSERPVVLWNTMLTAYMEHDQAQTALGLYNQMHKEGVTPDEITFACVVKACSKTGSLDILRQVHSTLRTNVSPLISNTLISAYGRCASMVDAQHVFYAIAHPDVVSWNALITAYARQGDYEASLQCYEEMQLSGMVPDGVTFLSLISACSHAGLVDQGIAYLESMSRDHGISPKMEHYVSMVDLFGRAGYFTRVEEVLAAMPMQPNLETWLCLMAACRQHGKVELAERAFNCAVRLHPQHAAPYLLLSNIYADAGFLDCAKKVKRLREQEGAWKTPGQSWIEHGQEMHIFLVGDSKQPQGASRLT